MEDFSELIISLIVAAVIFLINSMGSKKKKQAKNQTATQQFSDFKEGSKPNTENLTWSDIFQELSLDKTPITQSVTNEEDDYIPRVTYPASEPPQSQFVKSTPSPNDEGMPAIQRPIEPIAMEEIADLNEPIFDPEEIDWRQTVMASEILKRKYT